MGIISLNGDGPTQEQPQRMSLDLNQASDIECSSCANRFFQEVMFFKKISALISPTGQAAIIPIPTYACLECGNINKEFLPSNNQ